MESKDNMGLILKILYRRRKWIILVVASVSIITALVSLLLPNYYKATTSFFAASLDMTKPEHFFGNSQRDMEYYGTDAEVERLLTIAQSAEMYQFLIDSFDLGRKYGIDTTQIKAKYTLVEIIDGIYKVNKTKYKALELSFEDVDREEAAKVANAARNHVDRISRRLIREQQANYIQALRQSLDMKAEALFAISDSLERLRRQYNILNSSAQSSALGELITETESKLIRERGKYDALQDAKNVRRDTIELIGATVKGLEKELSVLKEPGGRGSLNISSFNEGRIKVEVMEGNFYSAREHYGYNLERLRQLEAAYQAEIPGVYVIEAATPPLVKSRPKRSLYVLSAFLISLLLSSLFVLLQESIRHYKWNEASGDS